MSKTQASSNRPKPTARQNYSPSGVTKERMAGGSTTWKAPGTTMHVRLFGRRTATVTAVLKAITSSRQARGHQPCVLNDQLGPWCQELCELAAWKWRCR
jgi:hypothetical protein